MTKQSKRKRKKSDQSVESGDPKSGLYSVIPITEVAPLPGVIVPLYVSEERSVAALSHSIETGTPVVLVLQLSGEEDRPEAGDLAMVAGIATILQSVRAESGDIQASLHVQNRVLIESIEQVEPFILAKAYAVSKEKNLVIAAEEEKQIEILKQNIRLLSEYDEALREHMDLIEHTLDPGQLADLAGSIIPLRPVDAQRILEELDQSKRLAVAIELAEAQLKALRIRSRIEVRAGDEMEDAKQKELLREQIRLIRQELGEDEEDEELKSIKERIETLNLPEPLLNEVGKQLRRLSRMHPDAGEAALQRTYIDWILELPWNTSTVDRISLDEAREVLDQDHYGLDEAKERILDFLGVRKLSSSRRGPLLLFVGPPGVGKTSLGRSIAQAMGRNFARISVGGLRDEAELRGHRRTYVGAMPGRIIQGLRRAGSRNPVFVLDELDKIGSDFRGDPASVLLEILDREQNASFEDHYLNMPFDLSEVLFIGTANVTDTIPAPLLDRMEVVEINGYTRKEKLHIARNFICPREQEEHGLADHSIELSDKSIQHIVNGYTRESGVRTLQRRLATVYRKIAREVAEGRKAPATVTPKMVQKMLGPVKHVPDRRLLKDEVGLVCGLAWTSVGGEILVVESSRMKGKGELSITGQIGDVMQESAKAALSYVLSHAEVLGISTNLYENSRIHIHLPEGAIPKDGPSAGTAIATALVSVLTGRPVSHTVAMTGEITLRGKVLPIGGLREKALAALRAGMKTVIIPKENERELVDFPKYLLDEIDFLPVESIDEVFAAALKPLSELQRKVGARKHLPVVKRPIIK